MLDYDYQEPNDYNEEQFFALQDNWEEYQSLMEDWEEPTPQEKDEAYIIFTLEQALSSLKEFGNALGEIGVAAENATRMINEFIRVYTKENKEN